jgi:hypothetical protein
VGSSAGWLISISSTDFIGLSFGQPHCGQIVLAAINPALQLTQLSNSTNAVFLNFSYNNVRM